MLQACSPGVGGWTTRLGAPWAGPSRLGQRAGDVRWTPASPHDGMAQRRVSQNMSHYSAAPGLSLCRVPTDKPQVFVGSA